MSGRHAVEPQAQSHLGHPHTRIDGPAKVTGTATFASDIPLPGLAHAALITSTIVRGRIVGFELESAKSMPGVLGLFTHRDFAGAIRPVDHLMAGGYANSSHLPLDSDAVAYAGQIVAVVVAETRDMAQAAALRVRVTYQESPFAAGFDEPGAETVRLADLKPDHHDPRTGDAAAAMTSAPVRVEPRPRRYPSVRCWPSMVGTSRISQSADRSKRTAESRATRADLGSLDHDM